MRIVGNSVLVKTELQFLKALSLGYRRIYVRSKVSGPLRKTSYVWNSPYYEREDLSYCHKEFGFRVCGYLDRFYYNPCYSNQRWELSKYLKPLSRSSKLTIVGGGIGIFGYYLSELYLKIRSYDKNPQCKRFGEFNRDLNGITNLSFYGKNRGKYPENDLLIMIPSLKHSKLMNYRFGKNLVIYSLVNELEVSSLKSKLEKTYKAKFFFKTVRPYCRGVSVYRIHCHR